MNKSKSLLLKSATAIAIVAAAGTLALAAAPAKAVSATHSLTIHSAEALQLSQNEEKEWYERSWWPLLGAFGALIATNAVSVWVVYIQATKSFNAVLRQRKIELLSTALNEFYNPLLALIDINGEIFTKTGPISFPKEEPARSAAGLVWKETKKKILVNNLEIERILRTNSHLLQGTDTLNAYHPLLVHVAMYETFQKIETDLYTGFLFPAGIRKHIEQHRIETLEAFYDASGEQI